MIYYFGSQNRMKNGSAHWNRFGKITIHGDTVLNKGFREFIESLNEHNVRYLVVGGYAVAFHGNPHYTKNLDVWIEMSPANAKNIVDALQKFHFGSLELKPEDCYEAGVKVQNSRSSY